MGCGSGSGSGIGSAGGSGSGSGSDRSLGVSPSIAKKGKGKGGRKAANSQMTEEERRQERILKNRVSAMKSLQKKKRYTDDLEQRAKILSSQNHDLKTKIYALLARLTQAGYTLNTPYERADVAYYNSNADHLLQQLLANFRYHTAYQHAPQPNYMPHPAHQPPHQPSHQQPQHAPPGRPRAAACGSHMPTSSGPVAPPPSTHATQGSPPMPPHVPQHVPSGASLDDVDHIGESFLADAALGVEFDVPEL